MGQKVHPLGFRIGITEDWRSRWFAPKSAYGEFVIEEYKIRELLNTRLNRTPPFPGCSKIEIERTRNELKVVLSTARPGLVIGPKGAEVDKLKDAIEDLVDRKVNINIKEIKNPDLDAQLIALSIAEQFKKRTSFRRVMKMRCEAAMSSGAKGIKIICKGRLGGSEMSRRERQMVGSIPLQKLQACVDYGYAVSYTKAGTVGVRVWLHKGTYDDLIDEEASSKARGPRSRARF